MLNYLKYNSVILVHLLLLFKQYLFWLPYFLLGVTVIAKDYGD